MRTWIISLTAVATLAAPGCSEKGSRDFLQRSSLSDDAGGSPPATAKSEAAMAPGADKPAVAPARAARKIIFQGTLGVTVEDFARSEQDLIALVARHQGYLAESSIQGSSESHRSGTWRVRIPIDQFDPFVDAVAKLGEPTDRRTTSEDVTDEFFDLEARIKNKAAEEARLIRHLEVSTGKLEEILQVERELSRVREEVERMQGRRQMLENLTSLTTVTVQLRERLGYKPPEAPTFTTRVIRSFQNSAANLVACVTWCVLALAALVPWLPVITIGVLLAGLAVRRTRHAWFQPERP